MAAQRPASTEKCNTLTKFGEIASLSLSEMKYNWLGNGFLQLSHLPG